jgi:hypothetical protein
VKKLDKSTKAILVGGIIFGLVGFGTSACGDKFNEPFKDAPRSYHDVSLPMDVIQGADGFSNAGTSCDGHGGRVTVAYHGDNAYGSVAYAPYASLAPDDPCRAYRWSKGR